MEYNLLFRWFVGLDMDDQLRNASTFSQNRKGLPRSEVAPGFFDQARRQAECKRTVVAVWKQGRPAGKLGG